MAATPVPKASAQHSFRFGLPPSLGAATRDHAPRLERFLARSLNKLVEVSVSASYEGLGKDVLASKVDAAWAPPFVCARLEAMGARVAARGVRRGSAVYRGALVCRANRLLALDKLEGTRAAWVDRDSVAGYLLPLALLRTRGLDPAKVFFSQELAGSYRAAVEAVLADRADVTSVYAPPTAAAGGEAPTGLNEIIPGRSGDLRVIAFTDEAPNDGVIVSMGLSPELLGGVEKAILAMHESTDGALLLRDLFHAERFEPAPRLGYRALYRVALATL